MATQGDNVMSLPIGEGPGVETQMLGFGRDGGVRGKMVRNKEGGQKVRYQQSGEATGEHTLCAKVDGKFCP